MYKIFFIWIVEAVAKLHGSGKSVILGHPARTGGTYPDRAAAAGPAREDR
jgi:hypothetical protein